MSTVTNGSASAAAAAANGALPPCPAAADGGGKRYWSYEQLQQLIQHTVLEHKVFASWQPTLVVCIAAGGFVPTRILRSCLKQQLGHNVPIQTVGLQLYDIEGADPSTSPVQRTQWLSCGSGPGQLLLNGHRILIVDEVDDSRKTLSCAVSELTADIAREREAFEQGRLASAAAAASGNPQQQEQPATWVEPELAVFVVHNKLRPKLAALPDDLMRDRYFSCIDIPDCWCVYPWDAADIYGHSAIAEEQASGLALHGKRQSSGCPLPAGNGAARLAAGVNGSS